MQTIKSGFESLLYRRRSGNVSVVYKNIRFRFYRKLFSAPLVQWSEQMFCKHRIPVQFRYGAPNISIDYLIKLRKYKLEHKDGNCDNNALSNLELLCPNCHSLTPTYKGANKNKNKAGSSRYKYWKKSFSNRSDVIKLDRT